MISNLFLLEVQSNPIIANKSVSIQKLSLEKSVHNQPLQQKEQYYIRQQPDQIQCPQFTAPNLSQYHFVSSQEVSNKIVFTNLKLIYDCKYDKYCIQTFSLSPTINADKSVSTIMCL